MSISMIERSAWRDFVSSPASSTFPKTAPATRKFAAALQSPSRSISAALYLCPPLTLKTISVHSDQSPPDSRKSLPPSISFPILMPNFFRTSRVMNIYGMLFGSVTMTDEFLSANGRAISRPEMSWEPCFPEISARPAFSGPATVRGTHTGASASPPSFRAIAQSSFRPGVQLSFRLGVQLSFRPDVQLSFRPTEASGEISAPKASIISRAPVRGRPRRVFSPVKVTDPGHN